MEKIRQELEKSLSDYQDQNNKFLLPDNTSDFFDVVSRGISYSESTNFNESVEITSIGEAKSRSVKYIIRFNIVDLFEYTAGAVITIAGSVTMPWIIILGFLILLKQLYVASEVDIDENASKVLWGMYLVNSGNSPNNPIKLNFENIFINVNLELQKRGYTPLSKGEIENSLIKLEELYIIERIGDEWEIIEFIQVNKLIEV